MKLKLIILLFCSFSAYNISGQATNIFNDYHKLSFQFGVSRYFGSETSTLPNTLSYEFNNFTSPKFGFYYDILQTEKFNFKIGLSTLLVREIDKYFIDDSQIPDVDTDYGFTIESNGLWRFNLPITAEYFIPINSNKLIVNSSFIIGYSADFGETESQYRIKAFQNEEFTQLTSVYTSTTWYFNAQLGVGMYFPFEKWMLRVNAYYNFALQDLYEGKFTFSNLAQSPDTSGDISFRGDSFGMEFSIYLKKKKKN